MPLPYAKNALTPNISEETFNYHYGKHHQAYVNNINNLKKGSKYENMKLEEIIIESSKDASAKGVFNNSAQVYNHDFYWNCLTDKKDTKLAGKLLQKIEDTFESFDKFKEDFTKACVTSFGSAWVWLVKDGENLSIMVTSNADTPIVHGKKPILTCDMWEHAYYIDYRNDKKAYLDNFLKIVNWDFVASNL